MPALSAEQEDKQSMRNYYAETMDCYNALFGEANDQYWPKSDSKFMKDE